MSEYSRFVESTAHVHHDAVKHFLTLGKEDQIRYLNLSYAVLGLAGEAGELPNKVKKILRDDGGKLGRSRRGEILMELGDVMWYIQDICNELEITVSDLMLMNMEKLKSRARRGTLKGDGDER
jgi:NTP pyrophosphatase (non-canonical NTP hydrolase)